MAQSILDSTKKVLGVPADYDAFDVDIIMHINSVLATLQQLGVGPAEGFMIEGKEETWEEYLQGNINLNPVKTYVYLRVRLLFDPPTTSYLINALEKQKEELEWRLNVKREEEEWTAPVEQPSTYL